MGGDVMTEKWIENGNGNWVWVGPDGVSATVYATHNGWGGVWNGPADGRPRRLNAKGEDAEEGMSLIEEAVSQGDASLMWSPPDEEWKERKKGGYYRKVNGAVVSVKQARSGSWYAVHDGDLLGQSGSPMWFITAKEACTAVDDLDAGSGLWHWIARQ